MQSYQKLNAEIVLTTSFPEVAFLRSHESRAATNKKMTSVCKPELTYFNLFRLRRTSLSKFEIADIHPGQKRSGLVLYQDPTNSVAPSLRNLHLRRDVSLLSPSSGWNALSQTYTSGPSRNLLLSKDPPP